MSGFDDDDEQFEYCDDIEVEGFEGLAPPESYADASDGGEAESLTPEQVAAAVERARAKRMEPRPFVLKASKKRIAVVDTETDPFAQGLVVKPFTLGFYDGERYVDFWGDDCVDQFFMYLATLEDEYIIYAHNGGKFDFFFFLPYLAKDQSPLIMGGRLVKIMFGKQEFRDSFAIIPQALSAYKKDDIDYMLFTRDKREANRVKILEYQKTDCVYTYELIAGFHEMFGDKVTIASASLPMLHSLHGFERIESDQADARFRKFFYGGRNQCFETGDLRPRPGKQFLMYDRRSMYPSAMAEQLHPISATYDLQTKITDDTDFACIIARNRGALPTRDDAGGLDFTVPYGEFFATIHEINAGIETGTLDVLRVKHAYAFHRKASFRDFVEKFDRLRQAAKDCDDLIRAILYKFVLNSGYGKFALNPRKFKQYIMTVDEIPPPSEGWQFHASQGDIMIWQRPSPRKKGFYNVATAASITGAARANLLRNLRLADRPIYCDTDSILCEGFRGNLGNSLGQWQLEATGNRAAIAGKKLYALWDNERSLKKACKGVNLTPAEILSVCKGEEITFRSPVPSFSLDKTPRFVTRRVNKTGVV